jgi:hypothetical protein
MRIKRALTVADIEAFKPHVLEFSGEWQEAIGNPELTGSWIIWGNSANGKTRFALQLAKYLANFKRVAYNSIEEGLSASMKTAIKEVGMTEAKRNFLLLDKEPIAELKERLRKKRSPEIVFIDSLQYTGLTYAEYKSLRDEFRNKLFVFISHAEGKEPKGQVGKSVKYDAFVKIWVEGYKALSQSRYGGGKPYTIWQKGAADYWDRI